MIRIPYENTKEPQELIGFGIYYGNAKFKGIAPQAGTYFEVWVAPFSSIGIYYLCAYQNLFSTN